MSQLFFVLLGIVCLNLSTLAQEGASVPESTPTPQAIPSSPYALPFQLRPTAAKNVIRLDTAYSNYQARTSNLEGSEIVSVITGSYLLNPKLALLGRLGVLHNEAPDGTPKGNSVTNPLLGLLLSGAFDQNLKWSAFMGVAFPAGMGGGNYPESGVRTANTTATLARSAMDNALFAVNYLTLAPGFGVSYLKNSWTLQGEITLLQLLRTRGEMVDSDSTRTNLTSGLSAGYFVMDHLSLHSELRYQRWLVNDAVFATTTPAKDNMSLALGARYEMKWGDLTLKPGISYVQGLSGAIANGDTSSATHSHHIYFIDFPIFY
jgi:hypothetical protein